MLVLALALVVAGNAVDDRIAHGDAALEALDYDVAADELTAAASDPSATPEQRFRANALAATANVIVGRSAIALMQFRAVLLEKPDYELAADAPEKVVTFFSAVKAAAPSPTSVPKVMHTQAAPHPLPRPPALPAVSSSPKPAASSSLWPVVAAVSGGTLVLAGSVVAGSAELALGNAALTLDDRATWQLTGRVALAVGCAGVVMAAVGGAFALSP